MEWLRDGLATTARLSPLRHWRRRWPAGAPANPSFGAAAGGREGFYRQGRPVFPPIGAGLPSSCCCFVGFKAPGIFRPGLALDGRRFISWNSDGLVDGLGSPGLAAAIRLPHWVLSQCRNSRPALRRPSTGRARRPDGIGGPAQCCSPGPHGTQRAPLGSCQERRARASAPQLRGGEVPGRAACSDSCSRSASGRHRRPARRAMKAACSKAPAASLRREVASARL